MGWGKISLANSACIYMGLEKSPGHLPIRHDPMLFPGFSFGHQSSTWLILNI